MPAPAQSSTTAAGQLFIFDHPEPLWEAAADQIAQTIRRQQGRATLGLATGSTPRALYRILARHHQEGGLSFQNVSTYNLDEYYPISPLDPNSYRLYMHQHLFSKIDIPPNRAHVLDGTVPESAVEAHCAEFERWIEHDGGLDLQLLGIGRNGHIGFNEPSNLPPDQAAALPTRKMPLHPVTRADAARDFGGNEAHVPAFALTLGTRAILSARAILILATGPSKAEAVAKAIQGPVSSQVPASFLHTVAPKVTWMIDRAAAQALR